MTDHKLSDDGLRALLEQDLWSLHKEIRDCEGAIANEVRWHTEGRQDSAKTIDRIQAHSKRISELSYEMGQLNVHLEQVEERLRERDQALAQTEPQESGPAREDKLDWLRPVLNSPYFEVERQDDTHEPERDPSRR